MSPRLSADSAFVIVVTRATLSSVLSDQGKFDEGLQTAREAYEECRTHGLTGMPGAGFVMTIYGGFLTEAGQYAEADSVLVEAYRIIHLLLAPKSLWTGDNLRNQAMLLYRTGRYNAALEKADETLHIYDESFGPHYDNYPTALIIHGLSLDRLGRTADAERDLREALRLRGESMPPGHFFTSLAQSALGEFLTHQNRFAEAEPLLVGSYEDLNRSQGSGNPRTVLARTRVHDLYLAWKKPDQASKYQHP